MIFSCNSDREGSPLFIFGMGLLSGVSGAGGRSIGRSPEENTFASNWNHGGISCDVHFAGHLRSNRTNV